MKTSLKHQPFIGLAAILIIASIAGCTEVRKLTYSESFIYIENKEVKNLMRQMSMGVNRLGQIVAKTTTTDTAQQQKITSELSKLENIATKLSVSHTQTNQLFISDHIEQFLTDIGTAKMFAKMNPPEYSEVEEIVSHCQACHKLH